MLQKRQVNNSTPDIANELVWLKEISKVSRIKSLRNTEESMKGKQKTHANYKKPKPPQVKVLHSSNINKIYRQN